MKEKTKLILIIIFVIAIIGIYVFLILLYGPTKGFRDWLIGTAMETMNHQYLAKWFYDEETIEDFQNRNSISDFAFSTDLKQIQFVDYSKLDNLEYKDEYEKQIFQKETNNNDYKIIKIKGEKYDGYLAVIYDPTRVDVAVTKYLGKDGQYLTTISDQNNSYVAVTGGGFVDLGGGGTGGEPLGITIDNGKLLHETFYIKEQLKGGLIGLTNDHKLFLGDITSSEALSLGITDSVSFGPYLIINGVEANVKGIPGGLSPRTAIGQRKDGIFLFLVLDGDRTLGRGASYQDVLDIMKRYGAYNASSLDGGSSAGMTIKNILINNPTTRKWKL